MKLNEETQDFLLKTYFGADFPAIKETYSREKIIEACANRAYIDMARVIRYAKALDVEKEKENFKNDANELLKKEIALENNPIDIINKLKTFAESFKRIFINEFSVGMAQKWVNMTFKYLWLLGECPIAESNLEVPIDHFIIVAALQSPENSKNRYALGIANSLNLQTNYAWSKLCETKYEILQNEIKEKINERYPKLTCIRWEFNAWLEQARIESIK